MAHNSYRDFLQLLEQAGGLLENRLCIHGTNFLIFLVYFLHAQIVGWIRWQAFLCLLMMQMISKRNLWGYTTFRFLYFNGKVKPIYDIPYRPTILKMS